MEPIADIIPRAMNGIRRSDPTVPSNDAVPAEVVGTTKKRDRVRTLSDLVEVFGRREALENPDALIEARELKLTPEGLVEVPKLGAFQFNDWSRSQTASMTGLRWDRWFQNASGQERADEMNRRFARASGQVRLRTRSFMPSETRDVTGASGVLAAFVSSTYSPVPDSVVATKLAAKLGSGGAVEVVRFDITEMSVSYMLKLGDAYDKASDHHAEVGALWGCLTIRNSGVGFAALSIGLSLFRLLCKNGLAAPIPNALVMKRAHRGLDLDAIEAKLGEGLHDVEPRLHHSSRTLVASLKRAVPNVEEELKSVLKSARLPLRLLKSVMVAYAREPLANAFGVSQALTLAAQSVESEDRFELEQAAGRYLIWAGAHFNSPLP